MVHPSLLWIVNRHHSKTSIRICQQFISLASQNCRSGSNSIGRKIPNYKRKLFPHCVNTVTVCQFSSSSATNTTNNNNLTSERVATASTTTTNMTEPYVSGEVTHFGFEQVNVQEKESRVRKVFDNVADTYDVMNDFMSGGLHRLWKDYLCRTTKMESIARSIRTMESNTTTKSSSTPPVSFQVLDVAGGTGDVAFRFVDTAGCLERSKSSGIDPISITVCDINREMLRVGERRARERYGSAMIDESQALQFQYGNAQDLHTIPDDTYDMYTIAFGLRNVTDVDKALQEAYRVLKPGGRFLCLEFSQVPNEMLRSIYDTYSFHMIPAMGEYIAQDRASYQYLVESIRKFSNQPELLHRMNVAGFQHTKYTNLTGGIVALHEGYKV